MQTAKRPTSGPIGAVGNFKRTAKISLPSLSEMDYRNNVKSWKNPTDTSYVFFQILRRKHPSNAFSRAKKSPFREKRALIK